MDYRDIITTEPGKRSGQPCIRGLRMTVQDVLDSGVFSFCGGPRATIGRNAAI
jgi:hypothetical protein